MLPESGPAPLLLTIACARRPLDFTRALGLLLGEVVGTQRFAFGTRPPEREL